MSFVLLYIQLFRVVPFRDIGTGKLYFNRSKPGSHKEFCLSTQLGAFCPYQWPHCTVYKDIITVKDILLHIVQAATTISTTTLTFFQTRKKRNIARRKNDVPHAIDKGDNFVICLTASHILSIVFYEKELSLCYTFCIRLQLFSGLRPAGSQ